MTTVREFTWFAVTASLLACLSRPAAAADYKWAGTDAVENWHDGANWTNGTPPGAGDVAQFTAPYTGRVTVTNDTEVFDLPVYAAGIIDLTLDIASGKTLTSGRDRTQALELHNQSDLTVMHGTLDFLDKVYLETSAGMGLTIKSNGTVKANNDVNVGGYGGADQNKIVIQSGGQFLLTNGAAWLRLGDRRTSDPHGNWMLIDGAGSRCVTRYLNVSETSGANNYVIVTNGGALRVTLGNLNIGFTRPWATADSADSNSVTVTGSGSTGIQLAGYTYVGYNGNDNGLTVEDAGYYQADYLQVGSPSYARTGNTLAVRSGASLRCVNTFNVHSNSVVAIDGGAITSGAITVYQTAELRGRGLVNGAIAVNGTLTVGNPTGTLTIAGSDLTFGPNATARFTFTSPGFEPGTYGVVQDTGAAGEDVTFNGALDLTLSGCAGRTTVKIFDFDSYSGDFDPINVSGASATTQVTFDATDGTVTIVPGGTMLLVR